MTNPAVNSPPEVAERWLLCLRCAGLRFAVPVERVARASYLVAVQPVPGTPEYVVGLTTLDGNTVPMIDLALRLGLAGRDQYGLSDPVLWCHGVQRVVAMVVDEVEGVMSCGAPCERSQADLRAAGAPLDGVVECNGENWLVLDCERLLALDFSERLSEFQLDPQQLQQLLSGTPGAGNA